MHATAILQKIIPAVTAQLDVRNARTLFLAVEALLQGKRLTLMELARHFPGADYVHAPLKRLDRLIGNPAVQALHSRFYQATCLWLLRSTQPLIIVDWSELKTDGRWHLLRAGVVCRGRTMTLYEEVHPEARKNHPQVEAAFLKQLQHMLPSNACPVIVTDAGFRTPWFRAVEALGWHWVGRVRHRNFVRLLTSKNDNTGEWRDRTVLQASATTKPRHLGEAELTRSNALRCQLTLVRQKHRGRRQLTRQGTRACGGHAAKMAKSAHEPWLLAHSSSLAHLSAPQVVAIYGKRMQIEQAFRDLKSHRYGCAFEDTLTRYPRRLEILLLIHTLASLVAWLTAASLNQENAPKQKRKFESHYSLVTRGWDVLRRAQGRLRFSLAEATQELRAFIVQMA